MIEEIIIPPVFVFLISILIVFFILVTFRLITATRKNRKNDYIAVPIKYQGKSCPYCQFSLKQDSEVVVCRDCNIPHHKECWDQNGSCTTFGCQGLRYGQPSSTYSNSLVLETDMGETEHGSTVTKALSKGITLQGVLVGILIGFLLCVGILLLFFIY